MGVVAREPELAALVGFGGSGGDAHGSLGGIAHFARARHILHGSEGREGETYAVEVLRRELAEGLSGVDALGGIKGLVFLKLAAHRVGVGAGRLVREQVVRARNRLEIGEFHLDGNGLLALWQHQADALPRQRGLTCDSALHTVVELDLFVALDLAHVGLTEIVGLFDGLSRGKQAGHQAHHDKTKLFHII